MWYEISVDMYYNSTRNADDKQVTTNLHADSNYAGMSKFAAGGRLESIA